MEDVITRILKNIVKREIECMGIAIFLEVFRRVVMGEKYYYNSFSLQQWIGIIVIIAILSTIEQIVRDVRK